jgi:hypothetical protein
MKVFKKKARTGTLSRSDALRYCPVKNREIKEFRLENDLLEIHYPTTMRPWIAGLVKRLGGPPENTQIKKLQLDILGTAVWEMIDGKRSVRQIVQAFAETHRLQTKEAEVAVTEFIRKLGRRGLIGLR